MDKMFCFQCEQTARKESECGMLSGCTISGVCGKTPDVSHAQDKLTYEMVALATVAWKNGKCITSVIDRIVDGLFSTLTNVNFDQEQILQQTQTIIKIKNEIDCDSIVEMTSLYSGDMDTISLRSTLLFALRGMAAYAYHSRVLGKRDLEVDIWFIKGMMAISKDYTLDEWLILLMELGDINLKCMALLDEANTSTFGNPIPVQVPLKIEKGPFIVVSGHDLHDLKMLLEQTEEKGINVYTHGEMLPAHGYPELKKYTHLKGNLGTAWQNQQREFDNLPAPVLFTTNCLMPPKASYKDRVYTTSVVAFPELIHISSDENGHKDFSALINQSIRLGGYTQDKQLKGINGGTIVTTGFGRHTILNNAPAIIDAVKSETIKHFFLIGGCDGSKTGRNYYTEFAKQTPKDTIILTLACGKYRINDLDIGTIGPFPRIMDMGQCNDAYGAVQVALALSNALGCGLNELPLTLILSWYEQKAVCILLTLLSLGIKNIYIGPSIPAFFSEKVLNLMIDKFKLHPICSPSQDLTAILGN